MKVCVFCDDRDVRLPHIQRLFPALAKRGLDVHIVTRKPAELAGVTIEPFQVPRAGLTNPRRWQRRQEHYLRGFMRRFDVVNVQFLHDWGLTPEIIEHGCFVATAWGSDVVPPPGERPPPEGLVASRKALLRHADCVTTCGPAFAVEVEAFAGLHAGRVRVVPFGVDLTLFRPPDPLPARVGGPGVVGFFKGFREVYGPKVLLRAIPTVLKARPTTRFEFVGDGVQLDECRALAANLGVDSSIRWIPRQPNHRMPEHLARWDLTVIPSVHEAFGVAALEASAMQVAVIASDVGGLRDTVIDGETGVLVEPGSPDKLATAMVELLEEEPRRRRMGKAGRAFVEENYGSDLILDQWMQLYETVADLASTMV